MHTDQQAQDPSLELQQEMMAVIASGGLIPVADEKRMRLTSDAIVESQRSLRDIFSNPYVDLRKPYYLAAVQYYASKEKRDLRCLVSYEKRRLDTLSDMWWETREQDCARNLTLPEKQFLSDYNLLMIEYMSSFDTPLDLRAFTWRPPVCQMLEVRGLKNHTYVSATTGRSVSIYLGKQCCVDCQDTEFLVQRGIVVLV
eukprot:Tbor_TRINITY_DN4889_c0_g1::TRINITY_DN4889_c0_g1_i2::g.1336::m.1336/K10732/GINS1, PSF1; GINS complex subunit 1